MIGQHAVKIDKTVIDITTPEGRMAVRAYAYTIAADGDQATKDKLLAVVGRDDG